MTITTSASTMFTVTKTVPLSALAKGDTVVVIGKMSGTTVTATSIREGAARSAAAPAASAVAADAAVAAADSAVARAVPSHLTRPGWGRRPHPQLPCGSQPPRRPGRNHSTAGRLGLVAFDLKEITCRPMLAGGSFGPG